MENILCKIYGHKPVKKFRRVWTKNVSIGKMEIRRDKPFMVKMETLYCARCGKPILEDKEGKVS